jgi:peroxiredoxin/outer membrane lipoprotein-sorting protein
MLDTIRKAKTLSYKSIYHDTIGEERVFYQVWMKKPNMFYLEATIEDINQTGIIVGDGQYAWSYWPNGRPIYSGEDTKTYEEKRFNVFIKQPTQLDIFSIANSDVMKKSNCLPVMDPSLFIGIDDSLEPYIDWIKKVGEEKIDGVDCSIIEVSFYENKRSRCFWIAKSDNLPRKLQRIIRGPEEFVASEIWSDIILNKDIPLNRFSWEPPKGWEQWSPPSLEDRILRPGQKAPDFEFISLDGQKIKLSSLQGKIVWLNFWRFQCPPCRVELPFLEQIHKKYADQGIVVLGFNFSDDRQDALDFLTQNKISFPNIIDTSDEAVITGFMLYMARAAPVNYIINREGEIASSWLGFDMDNKQSNEGLEILKQLGIEIDGEFE